MMFIDDDRREACVPSSAVVEIAARDLLAACARESSRQARAMTHLDATLGAALGILRQPAAEDRDRPGLVAALAKDLQQADRLRQELEGLAKALELLAGLPSMSSILPAKQVRACTPFGDLQQRLLNVPEHGD